MSALTESTETTESDIHGAPEVEPNYDDVNTPMIALVAAVSAIVTLAVIIAVQAFFFQYNETLMKDRVIDQKTDVAKSMLTEQLQSVSEYAVVNKEEGIYAIPIERAMEIVVDEVNKDRETQKPPGDDAPVPAPSEPGDDESNMPMEPADSPEPADNPEPADSSDPMEPAEPESPMEESMEDGGDMEKAEEMIPEPPAPEPTPAPSETPGDDAEEPTESDFD